MYGVWCLEPASTFGYMERRIALASGLEVASQLTLRWGDYLGLSVGIHCNHKGPYEQKEEGERELMSEWRRKTPPAILGAEGG